LTITVDRVLGRWTANPPMKPGDHLTVRNGDTRISGEESTEVSRRWRVT